MIIQSFYKTYSIVIIRLELDIELDMLTKYHDLKSIPNQSDICLSSVSSGVLYDNKRKKTELENVRYFSYAKPILRAEKGRLMAVLPLYKRLLKIHDLIIE